MSFSKSFRGAPLAIIAAIAAFAAEQKTRDEQSGPGVIAGHAKEIELAEQELKPVLNNASTDIEHEVNIWGHANADGSGNFGWSLRRFDQQTPAIDLST